MTVFRVSLVAGIILLAAIGARAAGYPAPKAAGFHNCALIYHRDSRTADDLAPYVAYQKTGKPRHWMFDAFLFLIYTTQRKIRTEDGLTQKVDWEYHLDQWFQDGRDLQALDDAIETASRTLSPVASKRKIILSVPWLNPAVRDFGDVDGDGISEDLSTPGGRNAVLVWYTSEARRRFRAANYRHLNLWGFYWMREGLTRDAAPVVRTLSDIVHKAGERLLWIPYYRSTGWEKWKQCGIDLAIFQPNYSFTSRIYGGSAGRNRLAVTADLARRCGMGVEIEAGQVTTKAFDRRVFLEYLADGATSRSGYQKGTSAFYLDVDVVGETAASKDPAVRGIYDALARYVAGKPVADPDPVLKWEWTRGAGLLVGEATLPKPAYVGVVEVYLDEPKPKSWRGTLEVSVMPMGKAQWTPAGTASWTSPDVLSGRHQRLPVSVGLQAERLRLTFRAAPGCPAPIVTRATYDEYPPPKLTEPRAKAGSDAQ